MSAVDVAVVIVNYNTATLTINAVASIFAKPHCGRSVAVHVVDNASQEGDIETLAKAFSERGWNSRVTLHVSPLNLGFGSGNNLVLERLESPLPTYVFLLNPDAILENDAIGILAEFLDTHPAAAAAGAAIASPDGIPLTAAFRFPGVLSTFTGALAFGPVARVLQKWEVPLPPTTPTQQVDWVAGAAVMLRLETLRRVGFFDPAYFLYFEEVDLMRQLSLGGNEVWHVAEARVVHIEGAATGVRSSLESPKRLPAYWYESWRHYFLKNAGRTSAIAAAAAWYLGAIGNAWLMLLRGGRPQAPLRFYRDFWRIAVRPLLGLAPLPYD